MTLRNLRVALAAATLLACGVVLLVFQIAPELAAAYGRLVRPLGPALPRLTAELALPLLRVAPGAPHGESATTPGAAAVWLLFLLAPGAAFAWAARGADPPAVLARWVVAWSLLLPVAAALAALVLLGLVLPFGCLGPGAESCR